MDADIALGRADSVSVADFLLPFDSGAVILSLEASGVSIERTSDAGDIVLSATADPAAWRARWTASPADRAALPLGRLTRYRLRRVVPGTVRYYAEGYVSVAAGSAPASTITVVVPDPWPPVSCTRRQLVAQMGTDGLLTAFLGGDAGLAYTAQGVPADAATIEWEGGGPYAQGGDVYARIQSSAGLNGAQMSAFWVAAGLLPRWS